MKNLPNKIYLNFGEISQEEFDAEDYNKFSQLDESAVTFCEDKVYDTDQEYIRKEALFEWAKEEMLSHKRKASKIAANSLSNPLLDTHYASEEAYRMLIDKLNSM